MLQDGNLLPWCVSVRVLLQGLWHWHPCVLHARCCGSHRRSLVWAPVIMHYFSCSNALFYYSFHMKLMSFHVSACKGSAILLNPFINFLKNCTKPKNNCTCCMVVGFGHSLRLFILASLICSPSGEMSNPRKVVVHRRKLHFFNLQ